MHWVCMYIKKGLTEIWQKMNKCLCTSLFKVQLLCDLHVSSLRAHITTQINNYVVTRKLW